MDKKQPSAQSLFHLVRRYTNGSGLWGPEGPDDVKEPSVRDVIEAREMTENRAKEVVK